THARHVAYSTDIEVGEVTQLLGETQAHVMTLGLAKMAQDRTESNIYEPGRRSDIFDIMDRVVADELGESSKVFHTGADRRRCHQQSSRCQLGPLRSVQEFFECYLTLRSFAS